ncbi:hypothetical protein [Pseudomonas monsensis]|uniref:hypothetical protein n=1 Tax=Pseudomonas monsensis TaxID=2745509 RepID=UPI002ABC91EA|nr:hypothetical protein [Pseudomonas monsensis]MDZ3826083.1 hypothetical protein [Pseudomonas monsensis]
MRFTPNFSSGSKLAFLVATVFMLAGCPKPALYREPIVRYQQASTVVIEGARTEYGLANNREYDSLLNAHLAKRERISLSEIDKGDWRVISADALAVRMSALDALTKHGKLLLALASSDAPDRAKDAANSLDDAVKGLRSSLNNNSAPDTVDAKATAFAGVVAEVTKLTLEAKIQKALDSAIKSSESAVEGLIVSIKDDMANLYERRRNSLSSSRKSAVDAYNLELTQKIPDAEKLKKNISGIKKAEEDWDGLQLMLGAGPGLDAMLQAHQELVVYAKSPKNPQDFSELVEAVDAFVSSATAIADSIKVLRSGKE